MNKFIRLIDTGQVDCISDIVRVQKRFTNTQNWKSANNEEYCDIKLNVIYANRKKTIFIKSEKGWTQKINHVKQ